MKRKIIIAVLAFACVLSCSFAAACFGNGNNRVDVTGITLNKTELTLNLGESEKLIATVSPENTTYPEVYWSSDNVNIAGVDIDGTVTASGLTGTTTITATAQAFEATCTVTVKKPADGVYISDSNVTLAVGGETMLTASISPEDSTTSVVAWSVDLPDIVSVDGGKITALKQGIAEVTATADGASDSVRVTVTGDGLKYMLSDDGKSYSVEQNYDELVDMTEVEVAAEFNGKPVTKIGRWAFSSLDDVLKKLKIPASVTEIDCNSLNYCKQLDSIEVDANNPEFTSIDGILYNKAVTEWVYVPYGITGVVEVPETITEIAKGVFDERVNLSGVKMHDGVTSIGESSFANCTGLHSITIPENMTEIGDGAFWGCYKLWEIYNFSHLKIETGGDVWTATYGHIGLYAINILYDKSAPSGIHETDDGFTFYIARDYKTYLVDYTGEAAEIVLPESYEGADYEIGGYAFYKCDFLSRVTIPDSVTAIGDYAFNSCPNLKSVTIGSGVKSIGEYAFYYCASLTEITVPDSVTSIGQKAFSYCTGLTNVVLGNGLKQIGRWLFDGCSALSKITIQSSVTSIDGGAFWDCKALSVINFNGTKEQWAAVDKFDNWDKGAGAYTVIFAEDATL